MGGGGPRIAVEDVLRPPLELRLRGASASLAHLLRGPLLGDFRLRLDHVSPPGRARLRPPQLALAQLLPRLPYDPTPAFQRALERAAAAQHEGDASSDSDAPPWETPESEGVREGTLADFEKAVRKAVLSYPGPSRYARVLERKGQALVDRVWNASLTGTPGGRWLTRAGLVAGGGTAYVAAGRAVPFDLPALPAVPLGVPGLSLHVDYVKTPDVAMTDAPSLREVGFRVQLDLTRLVPALR